MGTIWSRLLIKWRLMQDQAERKLYTVIVTRYNLIQYFNRLLMSEPTS